MNNKLASPGPAGSMVLAFYLGGLFPIFTGLETSPTGFVILVALGVGGATVQLSAGLVSLKKNNILLGNMLMAFSAFMWLGSISNFLKLAYPEASINTAVCDGVVFLVMGIFMIGFTKPFLKMGLFNALFMLATDVFFLTSAFGFMLGVPILTVIGGWTCLLVVISIMVNVLREVYAGMKDFAE
ncbi:hypothetical protein [Synergistes jonesii]|uniref:GPR1/FUN34/yaaH family protein n=1 Tax=Synergistes jonesii TaxID=2754 RepID=A0A073J1I9_9BACT|nr:hypothetical protein [Synergistes jonesii]KEJ91547.1 hypothetical protein EH55_09065 [Synergistes jonesii]OFB60602.1 hypothetical protein JS73_10540 [Synergistes jonesii]OFB61586.1 hypothetical protein JS79_10690 [Synergistes jonesii]OFB65000.1 hypothetical protein JS72_03165 [Synergistes jonesii]OFB66799.1 hypothetical protein JS78_10565 [Synergistes jonesii]